MGTIIASYATGTADGGVGNDDVGPLIGSNSGGTIPKAYGFGTANGETVNTDGSPPSGCGGTCTASNLTLTAANNGGTEWDATASNTKGAWDFGDAMALPKLRIADYDGDGITYSCNNFPNPILCRSMRPLAGQRDTDRDGVFDVVDKDDDNDGYCDGDADEANTGSTVNAVGVPSGGCTAGDLDDDNDGLIEIHSIEMFVNIQNNLSGTSYDDEEDDGTGNLGDARGAPLTATTNCEGIDHDDDEGTDPVGVDHDNDDATPRIFLCGYELTRNLDFAQVAAWRPDNPDPDSATNKGFTGIGSAIGSEGLNAIFEGNGHIIYNLYMRNKSRRRTGGESVGLFRNTGNDAKIRNLGLINAHVYGDSAGRSKLGILVGRNAGMIKNSYVTGSVNGGDGGSSDRIGGLVGENSGSSASIIDSYATSVVYSGGGGRSNNEDYVGGLVGKNTATIIASYALGNTYGGLDSDHVGGLVGNNTGNITASYATGAIYGRGGNDYVGGLVGENNGSSATISACYAIGNVDGGAGDDKVGSLVGENNGSSATITASYATGAADGGAGDDDKVGSLVGSNSRGTITASYGFGAVTGSGGSAGNFSPSGVPAGTSANALQIADSATASTYVGAVWNQAASNTKGAWDFGDANTPPKLKYADYDGSGGTNYCDDDMLSNDIRDITCGSEIVERDPVDSDYDGVPDAKDVDDDNDGLIEIRTLDGLASMHNNLAGTSYDDTDDRATPDTGSHALYDCGETATSKGTFCGAPTTRPSTCPSGSPDVDPGTGSAETAYLCGYELTHNLDFAHPKSYVSRTVNTGWRPTNDNDDVVAPDSATNEGFPPLGGGLAAIFEGNEYAVHNLYMRHNTRGTPQFGLFRRTESTAVIRNLGLINAHVYGSSDLSSGNCFLGIGALVGGNGGTITNSYVTGTVKGHRSALARGVGNHCAVGGLVGTNHKKIIASYASMRVTAGVVGSRPNQVGGLVGHNGGGGKIIASYATGDVLGSSAKSFIGGLVGLIYGGTIMASYATVIVNGGDGRDIGGGLMGSIRGGRIVASYATGSIYGNAGNDYIGGLVGGNFPRTDIIASYATGNVHGGEGDDAVGKLVPGTNVTVTKSYGFGELDDVDQNPVGAPPMCGDKECTAITLTAAEAGDEWNDATNGTRYAWKFAEGDIPKLRYADYDGSITTYSCDNFPNRVHGEEITCADNNIPSDPPDVLTAALDRVSLLHGQNFDHDRDGIPDEKDKDDDGDGKLDIADRCPWGLSEGRDYDRDGCVDTFEDGDNDNDGVKNIADKCTSESRTGWESNSETDYDSDGCLDEDIDIGGGVTLDAEDDDDDNDGRNDLGADNAVGGTGVNADDNCRTVPNPDQTNSDTDALGDACDKDDDNDGVCDENVAVSTPITGDGVPSGGCIAGGDVDDDNDGLIEIRSLEMLLNIQNDLAGHSYDTDETDTSGAAYGTCDTPTNKGSVCGAPTAGTAAMANCSARDHDGDGGTTPAIYLCGYELTRDLDFADADSYSGAIDYAWLPASTTSPTDDTTLSSADVASNVGFPGLGASSAIATDGGFAAIFEGNGHSISHLYMRNTTAGTGKNMGFFRRTESTAVIRNLGLINANIYGGNGSDKVGALVGQNHGDITGNYAEQGSVNGGDGNEDYVGGLVGQNYDDITASYATSNVNGGAGDTDYVGGLVGSNKADTSTIPNIIASYAKGNARGGGGDTDYVGGLAGENEGSILASYATGDSYGDAGHDIVGGLVGRFRVDKGVRPSIRASYATGSVYGDAGNDHIGGLVGRIWRNDAPSHTPETIDDLASGDKASIIASYATGTLDGGNGNLLVGHYDGDNAAANTEIKDSYGFGSIGSRVGGSSGSDKPGSITNANGLTSDNAGGFWSSDSEYTVGAWDFGTSSDPPKLRYADYDGAA